MSLKKTRQKSRCISIGSIQILPLHTATFGKTRLWRYTGGGGIYRGMAIQLNMFVDGNDEG